jgi:putative SOS response-associated peptidase YedK
MCLDISFKIDETEDSLLEYLPNLIVDPQLKFELEDNAHICALDRPKTRIIYTNAEGLPTMTLMRWGIMTDYMARDEKEFAKYQGNMFNARSERFFDTDSIWSRLTMNKCLIVAPGIYEHRKIIGWKMKVPYYVSLKSGKPLLIPGLYYYLKLTKEELKSIQAMGNKELNRALNKILNLETGEIIGTFTMFTIGANELMKDIHNDGENKFRMPLFMQPERAIKWINPKLSTRDAKEFLPYQIPSEDLNAWPVDTIRTTNLRKDGKRKHEPYEWKNLPPLGNDYPYTPQISLF